MELIFALPALRSTQLAKQLARSALIGRSKPLRQTLHQVYEDAPGEQPEPGSRLRRAKAPGCSASFERLSWTVQLGEATMDIALDHGSLRSECQRAPVCELHLALHSGAPEALFDAALQICPHISLLPLHLSQVERAQRLGQGTLYAPLRARPAALEPGMAFEEAARSVLREAFVQFSSNLHSLRSSDAPELLHQCRVGWRRFRSALWFFKQLEPDGPQAELAGLQALLEQLRSLRDLDVAAHEVLPAYASAYQEDVPARVAHWQQLEEALAQASHSQRTALRLLLDAPAVGQSLLQISRWLALGPLQLPRGQRKRTAQPLAQWVAGRMDDLVVQLACAQLQPADEPSQRSVHLLSRRLRYCVESLRPLLPKKRAERWQHSATQLQTRLGLARDLQQTIATAAQLQAPETLIAFLRGAAFGAGQHP